MKAGELMLGDYVRFKHGIDKVVGVSWVPGLGECAWFAASATLFPESVEDVNPIPITPEILEKNGFEKDFYEDESVADYVKVRLEGYSLRCKANGWDDALVTWCNGHLEVVTDFNGEVRKDIDHIHELQHALRLCGIDKEIII